MRPTALTLLALLVLSIAPPVHAGTATAPEITDDPNDQRAAGAIPISTQPPAGTTVGLNVDLLAGWVAETPDTLQFTIQIQGEGKPTGSSTTTWAFHFTTGGHSLQASATQEMASQADTGQPGTGAIKPGGVASSASAAGDHLIVLTVPKVVLSNPGPGTLFSNLYVTATGKTAGAADTVTDRAPNAGGFGANYTLTGGSAAKTVRGTLSGANVTLAQTFLNATTASYVYNWTQGPANATVRLAVHGSGNATVTVRDAANATLVRQGATATLNVTGKAGRWTVTINYTAFKGDLSLSIAPRVPATAGGPGGGSGTQGADPGSPGAESSTTKKGTPAVGAIPVLAAGLGAALLARRRRTD